MTDWVGAKQLGMNGYSDFAGALPQSRDLPMNGAVMGGVPQPRLTGGGGLLPTAGAGGAGGGITPTQAIGTPYRGIGKTNLALEPGGPPPRGTAITPGLAPRAGLFESMLGGLTSQFTGVLPGFIRDPLVGLAGTAGQVLDVPTELLGHVPLPWVPDTRQAFGMLPATDEMARIRQIAISDPDTGLRYMAQYVRNHEAELTEAMHVPRMLAPFLMPDTNILERLISLPGIPQQMVARTYAGMGQRNLDETVLNADTSTLPPALQDIQQRYKAGELTRDQVLDELTQTGYAFTNDPFANFFLSIVTDPVIVGSFGTGLAARAVETGAVAARTTETLNAFIRSGAEGATAYNEARAVVLAREATGIKNAAPLLDDSEVTKLLTRDDKGVVNDLNGKIADQLRQHPDFQRHTDTAMQTLSRRQRALLTIEPGLQAAARISHTINEPFSVFGNDRVAGSMQALRSDRHVRAIAEVYGPGNVRRMFQAASREEGAYDKLVSAYGVWAANSEMGLIHQQSLVRTLQSAGVPEGLMDETPNVRIAQTGVISPDVMTRESMRQLQRVKPQFVFEQPTPVGGLTKVAKAERAETHAAWRAGQETLAAKRISYASGMSIEAATKLMKGADDNMLGLAEGAAFGKAIGDVLDARGKDLETLKADIEKATAAGDQELADKLTAQSHLIERYTLVGPRELTVTDAKELLKLTRSNAPDAAARLREAINRFDILHQNFEPELGRAGKLADDDILKATLGTFLEDALGGNVEGLDASLVSVLKPESLPDNIRSVVDQSVATNGPDAAYRVGLSPAQENRWRVTHDLEGRLVGAQPWVDYVAEAPPTFVPTRVDMVRSALFAPIRGERLLNDARRSFVFKAVEGTKYGMTRGEAERLFDAVRRAASERGIQPRGLTAGEFEGVVDNVHIDELTRQKLGDDGLALLTAQAFEGDVMTAGVTSKISGKLKTRTAGWDNWVGVVAERLYPMIRFTVNPLFQMQEWLEPYFFNILRGVKPGWSWNQLDRQTLAMLDRWKIGSMFEDQAEYAYVSAQGWGNTVQPGRFGQSGQIAVANEKHMKVYEVKQRKLLNYIREVRADSGENFKRAVLASSPNTWPDLVAHYGTSDAGELAVRYWIDKGIFHPDDPHYATFMAGATRPTALGKPVRINPTMLARHFERGTADNLRKDIAAGTLTEQQFRDDAILSTWDKDFVDRAWAVASSVEPDAWFGEMRAHLRRAGATPAEADLGVRVARDLTTANATTKDMGLHEYLATQYTSPALWLDSSRELPPRAYAQTVRSLVDDLRIARPDRQIEPVRAGSQKFSRIGDRVQALMPAPPKSRLNQLRAAKRNVDNGIGLQTVAAQTIELPGGERIFAGRHAPADVLGHVEEVMGTGEGITHAAHWASEIVDYYGAISQLLTDDEVAVLSSAMKDVPGALGDPREELAARLIMAFSGTQQRTSPLMGMQQVADMLDEMLRGDRAGEVLAPQPRDLGAVELGTTPVPPGMIRLYHYTGAPEEVRAQGLLRSKAKGETYGEPNVIWASAQKPDPGNHAGVVEFNVYPSELDMYGPPRTQAEIDSLMARGSNVTLNLDSIPPERFTALRTPADEGYTYLLREYGRTPTAERVQTVRSILAIPNIAEKDPRVAGYRRWLEQYDAGTLAPKPALTVHGKTHMGIERLTRVMRDWESVSDKGMGFKLYDFFDQMFNRKVRTLDPTDGLQPGAMDVWLHRGLGYMSPAWMKGAARRMVETDGAPTMAAAEAKIRAQLGIAPDAKLKDLTEAEYEGALRQVNDIVTYANETGWQGKRDWTAGEMQAVLWSYGQQVLDSPAEEVGTLARMNSRSVAFEVAPSQTNHPVEWLPPTGAETHASRQPVWNDLSLEQRATVTYDVARRMIPLIEDLTGARIIDRPIYAHGGWRTGEGLSLSPNTTWTIHGTEAQIDDAMDSLGYLLQQDEIFATKNTTLKAAAPAQGRHWAYDVKPLDPEKAHPAVMGALGEYLADAFPEMYGYMTARDLEGAQLLRSVWMPGSGARTQLAHFERRFAPRSDWNVEEELRNGTWTRRIDNPDYHGLADVDIPMVSNRTVVQVKQAINRREGYPDGSTFEHQRGLARQAVETGGTTAEEAYGRELGGPYLDAIRARGRTDLADRLARRHRDEAKAIVDDAFDSSAADARGHRGGQRRAAGLGAGPSTVVQQRGPRGVRGAISYSGGARSTLYLLKDADASTGVHELFHVFSRELDASAKDALLVAYKDAKGLKRKSTQWGVSHEEWAAKQFEHYVAGGAKQAPTPALRSVFNAFADWSKRAIGTSPAVDPRVSAVFDRFFAVADPAEARSTFDLDSYRWVKTIEDSFANGEEQAHTNNYYKRGRSWTERSVNHPYLGLYPASYMWGKVLPQMIRFLVHKPFGVAAPLAGLQMAKHTMFYAQLMVQTNPDLQQFVQDHPQTVRLLSLMLPGTPWDIPVNAPAWARHLAEDDQQNKLRVEQGLKAQPTDYGRVVSDTVNYAFGLGKGLQQPLDIMDEWNPKPAPDDAHSAAASIWSQLPQ